MDYKFSKYIEYDDGSVEATVRFYDGEVTTEDEYVQLSDGITIELQPVTRYRRTAVVEEVDYVFKDVESVKI
jgi:hypothetical protein